jgi:ABC-type Fe3+ transport system permease subunit
MTPAAIALVVAFLAAGLLLGWFGQKTYAAHGDIKVAKTRMRGGRKTRWRSGLWAVLIGALLVIAVKDILFPR